MTTKLLPVCLVLAAATWATPARADVDVEIDGVAKVKSDLAPEGETECFRFDAAPGTVLAASVAAKKKAPLDFTLTLDGPSGPIDITAAPKYKDGGKTISFTGLELADHGTYKLTVTATGTGEYALKVKAKPRKKWFETLTVKGNDERVFRFYAPLRSRVTLQAKQAKGSQTEPRFGNHNEETDLSTGGKIKPTSHKVVVGGIARLDQFVTVDNLAADEGDVVVTATVKPPKTKAQKLDLRGTLPVDTAYSATVNAENGGGVGVQSEGPLEAAGVSIPGGALTDDTRITIRSTEPTRVPDADEQQVAGPAVYFGPAGTTFATPAEVTVPYDPAMVPADADPMTDLRVIRVRGDGTFQELTPIDVNTAGQLVTVETDGFSTFMAVVPKGIPQLEGRSYWYLFTELELIPDTAGNDSRNRIGFHGMGSVTFGAEGQPGGVTFDGFENSVNLTHDGNGIAIETIQQDTVTGGAQWDYSAEGIRLTEPGDDPTAYRLGAGGDVLLAEAGTTGEDYVPLQEIFLEKPSVLPTAASVAGVYNYADFIWELRALQGGSAFVSGSRAFGTFVLKANGTWTISLKEGYAEISPGGGRQEDTETFTEGGTFSIEQTGEFAGAILLVFEDEEFGVIEERMFPSKDGEVILMAGRTMATNEFVQGVGIRQGSGLSSATLDGAYASVGFDFELTTYDIITPGVPQTVSDFNAYNVFGDPVFDGIDTVAFANETEREHSRDEGTAGGVRMGVDVVTNFNVDYTIDKKGRLTGGTPDGETNIVGATTSDGRLGFWLDEPGVDFFAFGMFLFIEVAQAR